MNQFTGTYQKEFVPVNGIEHYVLHFPKESDAPVLLFLHGGPGDFEAPFAYELDGIWGDMFTHVHWDQRGAGKTLCRNKKKGWPKSLDQMLEDLHGIVEHLRQVYQKEKIVLLGHSWGSVLGTRYAKEHPERVLAYIGVGQVVNMVENERTSYQDTLEKARKAGNLDHVRELESMGAYPPGDLEQLLQLLPKMRKIQAAYDENSVTGLVDTIRFMRRSPFFEWGYFFSRQLSRKVNHPLFLDLLAFDITADPPRCQVPVHYILGETDNITPTSLAKDYFDTIEAPEKSCTVIPKAGHNLIYDHAEEFAVALRAVRETL